MRCGQVHTCSTASGHEAPTSRLNMSRPVTYPLHWLASRCSTLQTGRRSDSTLVLQYVMPIRGCLGSRLLRCYSAHRQDWMVSSMSTVVSTLCSPSGPESMGRPGHVEPSGHPFLTIVDAREAQRSTASGRCAMCWHVDAHPKHACVVSGLTWLMFEPLQAAC